MSKLTIEPVTPKPVNSDSGIVLRPVGDHLIVIPIPEPEVTPSGLYIPETTTKPLRRARVVGIGPGMTDGKGNLVPMGVEMYEEVMIGGWVGTEVKVDGMVVLIIRIDDVAAVVE
jgi:chaperonin GroES